MAAFCHPKTVHTEGGRVGGGRLREQRRRMGSPNQEVHKTAGLLPHDPPTQKREERKTSSGRKRGPGWGEPRSTGNPTRGLPFRSGPEGEPQGGPEIRLLGNSDSSGSGSCLCSTQRSPEKQNFYYTLLSPRLLPAPRGPTTARARGAAGQFPKPGECPGLPASVVG